MRAVFQGGPVFTVNKIEDHNDGVCSAQDCTLREAIAMANQQSGDNTINFAPEIAGTIQLVAELPRLTSNLVLSGPGANVLTVRRQSGRYRIFAVSNGTDEGPTVTLSGMTIANGRAPAGEPGGGIFNQNGVLRVDLRDCRQQRHARRRPLQ